MSKSFKKSLNLLIITACIMCLVLQGIGLPSFAEIGRDTAAVNDGVRVSYEDVSGQVESLAQSEMLNNMTEETAALGQCRTAQKRQGSGAENRPENHRRTERQADARLRYGKRRIRV